MRQQVGKSVWISIWALGIALLLTLLLASLFAYSNDHRLRVLADHHAYMAAVRAVEVGLENKLDAMLSSDAALSNAILDNLRRDLTAIRVRGKHLNESTPERMQGLLRRVPALGTDAQAEIPVFLADLNGIIDAELASRGEQLQTIGGEIQVEKYAVTVLLVFIPLMALAVAYFLRRNVIASVRSIAELLGVLGDGDFQTTSVSNVPPLFRPAFDNYNVLVRRLKELEEHQSMRRASLEEEIKRANHRMIRLHQTLSNAEKLAAVGEIAARIAHELRNPLAGVRAALNNLQNEIGDPSHAKRLSLVNSELKRMTSLLNDLLEHSSHMPEPLTEIDLVAAVREVGTLAELQLDRQVSVHYILAPGLRCRVPEDRFRHAILNLMLNSGHAIGQKDGTITVEARPGENRSIRIVVADDGPGFSQDVIDSATQSFVSRRIHGTGLGLAIVRRFAQDLGGSIRIRNISPHGAEVALSFPSEPDLGR